MWGGNWDPSTVGRDLGSQYCGEGWDPSTHSGEGLGIPVLQGGTWDPSTAGRDLGSQYCGQSMCLAH